MPDDQGPNLEMRAFIAVVLSLAVMLLYQFFLAPEPPAPGPSTATAPPSAGAPASAAPPAGTQPGDVRPEQEAAETTPPAPAAATGEVVASDSESSYTVETDRYRMTISNRGARITSWILKDYEDDRGGPLELVVDAPGFEPAGMLNLATPDRPEVAAAANDALYVVTIDDRPPAAGSRRVDGTAVIRWLWSDGAGWRVEKSLSLEATSYLSTLQVAVASPTDTPVYLTLGPGLEENADARSSYYLVTGGLWFNGAGLESLKESDLAEPQVRTDNVAWGGIQSNYFLALFIPQSPATFRVSAVPLPAAADAETPGAGDASVNAKAAEDEPKGGPGTRADFGLELPDRSPIEMPLYVGPKSYDLLMAEGYDLERAVDYGMFAILARPIVISLQYLHDLTGNYGLAIILATLGVRLIFFPLAQSSMKSMRKMQQLQPQMNAIRNRYKGVKDMQKRQEMNNEIMQLYKDNNVSPLGGCLPMLLQMPVLFGFYAAISVSIDIRQAPFVLWIHDLSKMDPYYVLPLLMGGAMFAQQRMSPTTADPMQQKIFRLMPVMFTFFFLRFPSGLVIYWLVNTLLGIGQQAYVNHQLAGPDANATPASRAGKKGKPGGEAKRNKRGKR